MLKGIAKAEDLYTEDKFGRVIALSQLSEVLNNSKSDNCFTDTANIVSTLIDVPKSAVFVQSDKSIKLAALYGLNESDPEVLIAYQAAVRSVETSNTVIFPDSLSFISKNSTPFECKSNISLLCTPMRLTDISVGAIVAIGDKEKIFTATDADLLHIIASQAALAVWRLNSKESKSGKMLRDTENLVRLTQRKNEELSLLNRISEAMGSTLDLEKLLILALEHSMAAVSASVGSLMLISEETEKLEIVASKGLEKKWIDVTSQPVGKSIAGWVAKHGESVLVSNARKDSRFDMSFFRDNISSSASVPLKVKNKVIGVLNVNTAAETKQFDERDLQILNTVANQMAVAIDNARLYAKVNRQNLQLDSLLQISKTITSTLNLDEILKTLSDEICTLLQMDVCVILLVDELSEKFRLAYGSGLKKTKRKHAYYDLAYPLASHVKQIDMKIVLRDISASSLMKNDISDVEGLKSAICMPMKHRNRTVAIAAAFSHDIVSLPWSQREIMNPLGDLAGVAIQNARIYRQKYKMAEMVVQKFKSCEVPDFDGLDIGCKYLPAREVGGDYYDFVKVSDNSLAVVLGDVAGSDIDAAEYTSMGKHVLRAYARDCFSPRDVLCKTNTHICEDTEADVFISLFYALIDIDKMQIKYANAGCEPPLLFSASGNMVHTLNADGMLLGIIGNTTYEEKTISIGSGDILVMFTDGLTEAGIGNSRFGIEPIKKIISSNFNINAQQIADKLYDEVWEFVHGRVIDDVALIVVKIP